MTQRIEPLPPALADLARSMLEETLPGEEFARRAAEPMSADDRADIESLIAWFTHRYPTAAERLRYARNRSRHSMRALGQGPTKVVDVPNFVTRRLPKLSEVSGVVESGPLAGATIRLRAEPGDFDLELTREQYTLDVLGLAEADLPFLAGGRRFKVEKVLFSSRTGRQAEGGGVSVSMSAADDRSAQPRRFLHQINLSRDLKGVVFPASIEDAGGGFWARRYLPLPADVVPLDIYCLPAVGSGTAPTLIIESTSDFQSRDDFERYADAAWSLFSYFTGEASSGAFCNVGLDSAGNVADARWADGRVGQTHNYGVIPVGYTAWQRARRALDWKDESPPLNGPTFARCLAELIKHDDLRFTLFYLLTAPSAPLEMRGALLSVALESATKFVKAPQILPTDAWDLLRKELLHTVNRSGANDGSLDLIRDRISSLNSPSNEAKLFAPYDHLGISLTEGERSAIKTRNHYLHSGKIGRDPDQANWRELVRHEMCLYTAINKLVLKRLGYEGLVYDWGAGESPDGGAGFTSI